MIFRSTRLNRDADLAGWRRDKNESVDCGKAHETFVRRNNDLKWNPGNWSSAARA